MHFPYGLADFQKVREEGYLYLDRTDRIALIERAGNQLLLLRPRRFGKSLWLSTLENYYDIAKADRFEALFGGLAVGQAPTPRHNRYFVLKLNFSAVDPSGDRDGIGASLHNHINGCIEDFARRYRDRLPDPIPLHQDSFRSFRSLLSVVAASGHKLYLLIDEYDNFANEVMVRRDLGGERYQDLVRGEGLIKTFFKVVKEAAEGRGLDRVFITGVSPVVMSDITSGYNVIEAIDHLPEYHDLCGFTAQELRAVLEQVAAGHGFSPERTAEALELMRTFYNGYRFSPRHDGLVYNPTLALYFLKALARDGEYPGQLLDTNLAMDRNRVHYVALLPHGQSLVTQAVAASEGGAAVTIDQLADRFGVDAMREAPPDHTFLASLLYYFGVLTLAGQDELGRTRLTIPNLVVRKLYAERLREALLPDYVDQERRQAAATTFYAQGDLAPLCDHGPRMGRSGVTLAG